MKQNTKKWKIVVVGMLVAMLAVAIGCQDQVEKTTDNTLTTQSLPPMVLERIKFLEVYYDNLTVIELNDEGKKTVDRLVSEKKYSTVEVMHINATNNGYTILGKLKNLPKNESEVFTQVDEMAQPIFGLKALYEDIGHTIQYPANARRNGVEGKVFIEFVVQTDGTLSDIKVLRGVDEEIDSEALRAFYQLKDKWYPAIHQGQFVKVKMVLPIVFSLEG